MRSRFVHLGFNPIGAIAQLPNVGLPQGFYDLLENYLGVVSADWFRYGAQNYVLWTDRDLSQLAAEISELPGFGAIYVLVTEITVQVSSCSGWMPQPFWDWLQRERV